MSVALPQPGPSRHRALVVSDSGFQRVRLPRTLRRAGFDVPSAVEPRAATGPMRATDWDVVIWASTATERLARELNREAPGGPVVILIVDEAQPAAAVFSALEAGFADVLRSRSVGDELVARARATARRTSATRALRAEATLFRELVEGGRDLLARQAPDGTIRFASGAAREMLGCDPASLVGRRAADIFPPDAAWRDGGAYVHRVRRRDAGWVWMETTARLIHDGSGRVCEIHTGSRDVTGRVRADEERAAITRVTAAVAGGGSFDRIAGLIAREAATLMGAETGAVVRFHGDEGLVLGAVGPSLRLGERIPLVASGEGDLVAPVRVAGRPWGVVMTRGTPEAEPADRRGARLQRLAPLLALAVSNSRSQERLVAQATTDPLTGLANHGAFHRSLAAEDARARRSGTPLALVTIDLDHFKRINDTHGHQVGDDVLREVARRLVSCARRDDVAARVGGEELAWLLPGTGLEGAEEAAERLREAIAGTRFPVAGRVTASLGVAALGAGTAAEMVRRSDLALYRAKREGRNRCVALPADAPVTEAPSG